MRKKEGRKIQKRFAQSRKFRGRSKKRGGEEVAKKGARGPL